MRRKMGDYSDPNRLTEAEEEVLELLCRGYEAEEIARMRRCALSTIRIHMKRLREKRGGSIFKVVVRELRTQIGLPT